MNSSLTHGLTLKVCVVLFIIKCCVVCEQIVHTVTGKVGSGNLTYYTLKQEGVVTLILDSVEGDADIYISEKNMNPDYLEYDLQSATCGQDVLTIPKEFKRPVGIGIFGHVYHPMSRFVLTVVLDYDPSISSKDRSSYVSFIDGDTDTNESTLWVIFVNILKIIVEVLV